MLTFSMITFFSHTSTNTSTQNRNLGLSIDELSEHSRGCGHGWTEPCDLFNHISVKLYNETAIDCIAHLA